MIRPPALKKGDIIGILAPSSRTDAQTLAPGAEILTEAGYTVFIHPQTYAVDGQAAGTAAQRLAAFHEFAANPAIGAIVTATGGNRAGELLAGTDYELFAAHPKILLGFSDTTALLGAIQKETGLVTFHGPGLSRMRKLPPGQIAQCLALLSGQLADPPMDGARVLHPGTAAGKLTGGNLSLVTSLMGTPWQPDFAGAILFLEDIGDELSRIDRMLQQLANAGAFRAAAGLILGGFDNLSDTGRLPYARDIEQMIRPKIAGLEIPVVMDAPFGHGDRLYTLPIGAPAVLTAGSDGRVALALDGPAVSV